MTPRRPNIMEGPLVSDTTELLSDAAPASEGSPIGHSAVGAEGSAAPSRPQGRPVGDLSKLLVPDLQKIAHQLGIPGAGRMPKGQLVAAIEEHQAGGRSAAVELSATRGAYAGAGASRPLNQDAMEAGTTERPGIGDAPQAGGIGDAPRDTPSAALPAGTGIGEHTASTLAPVNSAGSAQATPAVAHGSQPQGDQSHGGDAGEAAYGDAQGIEGQSGEGRRDRRRNSRDGRDRRDGRDAREGS